MLVEGTMPRPYSADLRERVLSAHEHSEGNAAALAARFRVAVNRVKNWVRVAEREGRRIAKPLGRVAVRHRAGARRSVKRCANCIGGGRQRNDATVAE